MVIECRIPFQKEGGPYRIEQSYVFDEKGTEYDQREIYKNGELVKTIEKEALSEWGAYREAMMDVGLLLKTGSPEFFDFEEYRSFETGFKKESRFDSIIGDAYQVEERLLEGVLNGYKDGCQYQIYNKEDKEVLFVSPVYHAYDNLDNKDKIKEVLHKLYELELMGNIGVVKDAELLSSQIAHLTEERPSDDFDEVIVKNDNGVLSVKEYEQFVAEFKKRNPGCETAVKADSQFIREMMERGYTKMEIGKVIAENSSAAPKFSDKAREYAKMLIKEVNKIFAFANKKDKNPGVNR